LILVAADAHSWSIINCSLQREPLDLWYCELLGVF